jgi:hypothetical protein
MHAIVVCLSRALDCVIASRVRRKLSGHFPSSVVRYAMILRQSSLKLVMLSLANGCQDGSERRRDEFILGSDRPRALKRS